MIEFKWLLVKQLFLSWCKKCNLRKRLPTLTSDTRWFLLSVLKTAKVFPLTLGYHNPRALMMVRMRALSALSSDSKTRGEPHLATYKKVRDLYSLLYRW